MVIVTLGIYAIYWFYVTSKEMVAYKKLDWSQACGLYSSLYPWPISMPIGSTVRSSTLLLMGNTRPS
ncbi:MAG: DUF4234 domain-containing protein [Chloroflexi bacterium]|nr:DUF4234 domain-containing protein [Chloroflexota bacterium]